MRTKIIAGNWKMYKNFEETRTLVSAIKTTVNTDAKNVVVVLCPPFTSLSLAGEILTGSALKLGAQNMSEHDEGAYTGEISWKMLKSAGCDYVILGHSERRQYYHETNELVNLKAKKAVANGLHPIICVGETLAEREAGTTDTVIAAQIHGVLNGLAPEAVNASVIAYEPVWAIGTGKTATPVQAEDVHKKIRTLVSQLYNDSVADNLVIQYGGSVKPDNASELLAQNDIDGALVGGACLKADSFAAIVAAAKG